MTLEQAIAVLSATGHRGCRAWVYDGELARVMPFVWPREDPAPVFTAWEALTLARGLVEIGACGQRSLERHM